MKSKLYSLIIGLFVVIAAIFTFSEPKSIVSLVCGIMLILLSISITLVPLLDVKNENSQKRQIDPIFILDFCVFIFYIFPFVIPKLMEFID